MNTAKILVAATVLISVACTREKLNPEHSDEFKTICISTEEAVTKTALSPKGEGKYDVLWKSGDMVNVNGKNSQPLDRDYAAGEAATFSIPVTVTSPYNVIYPASICRNDGKVQLPSNQSYEYGQFCPSSAVMSARSESGNFTMSFASAFIAVTITRSAGNETLKEIRLHSNNNEPLGGIFTIDCANHSLKYSSEGKNNVSMSSEDGLVYNSDGTVRVIFSVPAGTYSKGFSVSATTSDGTYMGKTAYSSEGKTLEAGKLIEMPPLPFVPGGEIPDPTLTAFIEIPVSSDISKVFIHTTDGSLPDGKSTCVSALAGQKEGICRIAVRPGTYGNLRVFSVTSNGDYLDEYTSSVKLNDGESVVIFDQGLPKSVKGTVISDPSTLSAFLSASTSTTKGKVWVVGDIDAGGALTQASGFAGVLDGQEHCIRNLTSDKGLFSTNDGTLKNLTIEQDCSFTPSSNIFGCFVNENNGTLENLRNKADVKFQLNVISKSLCYGGIAGICCGPVLNCSNSGDILVNPTSSTVAAGVAGICGYLSGKAENCTNEGKISMSASFISANSKLKDISGAVPAVGGICAYGALGMSMADCRNDGAVEFALSSAENGLGKGRSQTGGIIGAPCGRIINCTNNGHIKTEVSRSSRGTAITEGKCTAYTGGIGGGDFYFTETGTYSNTDFISCVNNGDIDFYTDAEAENSEVGGIVGLQGREKPHTKICKFCKNYGKISCSGAGKLRAGGIQGGSGNMELCENRGIVQASGLGSKSAIGGLCGFHTSTHIIRNCSNFSDVLSDCSLTGGVGGVMGNQADQASSTGEMCIVNCKVKNVDSDRSYTGMVVGCYSGTTNKVIFGQSITPVYVKGKICLGSSDITITQTNIGTYKWGAANSSTKHKIYVSNAQQPSTKQEKLDAILSSLFPSGEPGAAVLVLEGDDVIFDKGYGIADVNTKKAIDGDTFFNIASVSKQFTAVGILQLAEKGKLSIEDPVSKFYPEWTKATFWKNVKIKHLISHCSGIQDERSEVLGLTDRQQKEANDETTMAYFPLITDDYLNFTPGAYYEYMNPTFGLCGDIIAKLSGKQFIDYMHDNVFVPAGMTGGTQYFSPETESEIPNMAHAYYEDSGKWYEYDYGEEYFFATRPDGGIYTSTHEFVKWEKALRENKVISEATRTLAHTPHTQVTGSPWSSYQNRENTWYGYGWFIEPKTSSTDEVIYHTGDNGEFQMLAARYPESNALILIFANRTDWERYDLMQQFESILGY